jgi:hypothetical protein
LRVAASARNGIRKERKGTSSVRFIARRGAKHAGGRMKSFSSTAEKTMKTMSDMSLPAEHGKEKA